MMSAAGWWSVLLLLLARPPSPTLACPSACQCWSQNRTAVCQGRRLPSVPRGFPATTRRLDLSDNLIRLVSRADWTRPSSWARRLEELNLRRNLLSQLRPGAFEGLGSLRALDLRANQLRLLEPGSLRGLSGLATLDLSLNPLVALLDGGLEGPSGLQALALGDPSLVHVGDEAFRGLGGLEQLVVEGLAVEEAPASALGLLANLTVLRLRDMPRPSLLPPAWLSGLGLLRALELDGWQGLGVLDPDALQGLTLVWLSITRCNLSEVPYAALRPLSQLRFLNLSHNPIRTIRGVLLHHVTRLQELRLAGAQLVSVAPGAFRGLAGLRLLDVTANQLDCLEVTSFRTAAGLQSLGLGNNPLACDCRLLWLARRRQRITFLGPGPMCTTPEPARGLRLDRMTEPFPAGAFRCRRPRIRDKSPAQQLQVREAQTVDLRCRASGIPPPDILWLNPRRQRLVPGPGPKIGPGVGRSRLLADGTLQITGVRPLDTGSYRCVARNAAGNDTASAWLQVRPLTASELALGSGPHPQHPAAAGPRALAIATTLGLASFLGVLATCFSLLLLWSRACGPIRHNTHIEFVPHAGGEDGEARADGRLNVKMV
ncbi:leucine-rich repeat and immunoglobulin-like domain-containing nogo receptor-interacting protein 1 [Narcine bancroftii]|uniref:leucine-rich repeat and immunoglobulin-like domain-containing nogo receptor-interacting protein 1 n=1 Tax=Narcine bancroftii TaxID=1343680 RepID=UPI00383106F5